MTPSIIFQTTCRFMPPVLTVLAVIALYRGHNLPGGGFIGGLIAASGPILALLSTGPKSARRMLRFSPETWLATGLATALTALCLPLLINLSLGTALWLPAFDAPLLGSVHLGTPLLFDIGVFATVIGFAMLSLLSFSESMDQVNEPA